MDDKYILAGIGCGCLTAYGIAAMFLGFNGSIATLVIGGLVGIVTGTIGFAIGKNN